MKTIIILVAVILWVAIAACIYTITHRPVDKRGSNVKSLTNNGTVYYYNATPYSTTGVVWFHPNSTNRTIAIPDTNP